MGLISKNSKRGSMELDSGSKTICRKVTLFLVMILGGSLIFSAAAVAAPYTEQVGSIDVTSGTGKTLTDGDYLLVSPGGVNVGGTGYSARGIYMHEGSSVDVKGGVSVAGSGNGATGILSSGGDISLNIESGVSVTSTGASNTGISASGTGTVTGDVAVNNGYGNKGIYLAGGGPSDSVLDLNGNILMSEGSNNTGVETAGARTTTNIDGDVTLSGGSVNYGVHAWLGGIANVTGNVTLDGDGFGNIGVRVRNDGSQANITADKIEIVDGFNNSGVKAELGGVANIDADFKISGSSNNAIHLDGSNNSTANQTGDIELSNGSALRGLYVESTSSTANMQGNIDVKNSTNSHAVSMFGGNTNLSGDISLENSSSSYGMNVTNGSIVHMDGDLSITGGSGNYGSFLSGSGTKVSLSGDVLMSGQTGTATSVGVYAMSGAIADVNGDITVAGDNKSTYGVIVYSEGTANVSGDIEATGAGNYGAYLMSSGALNLEGDIEARSGAYGVYANAGAPATYGVSSLKISGDILADAATGVYLNGGGNLNGSIINSGTITAANNGIGINVRNASNTKVTADKIIAENGATGVYVQYSSNTQISGDLFVGDNATGVKQDTLWSIKKTSQYTGDVNVYGDNATGLHVANGDNGLLSAGNISVTGNKATGAKAEDFAELHHEGDAIVSGTNAAAMHAAGGHIFLYGGTVKNDSDLAETALLVSNAGSVDLYGVYAEASNDRTLILSDSSGDVRADGSVLFGNVVHDGTEAGILSLLLSNDSVLVGAANAAGGGQIDLTLDGSSDHWYVTGDSATNGALNVASGSTVNYALSALGTTVSADSLAGVGNFFMKTDVAAEAGDILIVKGVSSGSHDITISQQNDATAATTGKERVTLVDTADTNSDFILTNGIVELGAWEYSLGNFANGSSGQLWQLYASDTSNPGSTGVDTYIASYLLATAENDTLIQRLGDLRNETFAGREGAWFRAFGAKFSSGARGYAKGFDMDAYGVQVGYDHRLENGWFKKGETYVGAFVGNSHGNMDNTSARYGTGDVEHRSMGMYWTYIGDTGYYFDAIAKYTWAQTEFSAKDSAGTMVNSGKSNAGGAGVSFETGKRLKLSGHWYMEPQAQLIWQHMGSARYNADNGLQIGVRGYDSLIGRAGLLLGYESAKTNVYAKVSYLKEFCAELDVVANGVGIYTEDLEDSWWVYGIGVTHRLNDRNSLYFDLQRASGGDFDQDWKVNGGWRITF